MAVAFFGGALGAIAGAIGVIVLRNPFYSVLALVLHLFSLAGLFLLLHAEFLAAAQVLVYAGAVMVLYVFVVAYVGGIAEPKMDPIPGQKLLAPAVALFLFVELSIAILGTGLAELGSRGVEIPLGFGSPEAVGRLLLDDFLIIFEVASIMLLLSAVAAIVLAFRRHEGDGKGPIPGEQIPVTRLPDVVPPATVPILRPGAEDAAETDRTPGDAGDDGGRN